MIRIVAMLRLIFCTQIFVTMIVFSCYASSTKNSRPYLKKEYYKNKKLKSITPFARGKKNGIGKYFYKNGKLQFEIPYKDGVIHGVGRTFDIKGRLVEITTYQNGKKNGIETRVNHQGKAKFQIKYIDGKPFEYRIKTKGKWEAWTHELDDDI